MFRKLSLLFIPVLLSACATTVQFHTPSGKPEVTISNSNIGSVKTATINQFVNAGFILDNESQNILSFSKDMSDSESIMYRALLGNAYSSKPKWHVRINVIPLQDKIRLIGTAYVKMQNASGQSQTQDMTSGKAGKQVMQMLTRIKESLDEQTGTAGASN